MMVHISRGNLPKTATRAVMGESKSTSVPGCSLEGVEKRPHPGVRVGSKAGSGLVVSIRMTLESSPDDLWAPLLRSAGCWPDLLTSGEYL